jgi:hypothetical protein
VFLVELPHVLSTPRDRDPKKLGKPTSVHFHPRGTGLESAPSLTGLLLQSTGLKLNGRFNVFPVQPWIFGHDCWNGVTGLVEIPNGRCGYPRARDAIGISGDIAIATNLSNVFGLTLAEGLDRERMS